jgi:hypothetical protein
LPASPYLPDRVSARIDEPGRQGKADVGDPVHGLEVGLVVLHQLHAAGAQLGDLGDEISDPPAGLRLLLPARGAGTGDDKSAVAAAPEGHEVVTLEQNIQPDPVAVELLRGPEVGCREHHVDRVLCEHVISFPADRERADRRCVNECDRSGSHAALASPSPSRRLLFRPASSKLRPGAMARCGSQAP